MRSRLTCLFAVLAAGAAALAALPWWFGAALRVAARPWHLEAGAYRRLGYARFELTGTVYERPPVRVMLGRIEADTPVLWLWRRMTGTERPVEAEDWSVVVTRRPPASRPRRPPGMVSLHTELEIAARRLERWLPLAEATNGTVSWDRGSFRIDRASWSGRTLAFSGLRSVLGVAEGRVEFKDGGRIAVEAAEPGRSWRTRLSWSGADATGEGWVGGQAIALGAHYAPLGWLPERAEADAPSWTIPGSATSLRVTYARIDGSGHAEWRDGAFSVDIHAKAAPKLPQAPPLSADIRLAGDRRGWSVDAFDVETAFGRARLDRPVRLGYGSGRPIRNAELEVRADLGRWTGTGLRGELSGRVLVEGKVGRKPKFAFSLRGTGISWRRGAFESVSAEGTWSDSVLDVARIALEGRAGRIDGSTECDFARRRVDAFRADVFLSREGLAPWLPRWIVASALRAEVEGSGPWAAVSHRGSFAVDGLGLASLKPIRAAGSWEGTGAAVQAFRADASAGATRLDVAGSGDKDGLTLGEVDFRPSGAGLWTQVGAARIDWSPGPALRGLRLAGPDGASIALALGGDPAVRAELRGVPTAWLGDLLDLKGPEIRVDALSLAGRSDRGRLLFAGNLSAAVRMDGRTASLSLSARDDGAGLLIPALRVEENGRTLAAAQGRLPVWWSVDRPEGPRVDPVGPIEVDARTASGSTFWASLARGFGLVLEGPQAQLRLAGTLRTPRGELEASVRRLSPAGRFAVKAPVLEDVALVAHADTASLVVDRLDGAIQGEKIRAAGRLPLGAGRWRSFLRHPAEAWRSAEGRIEVDDSPVAPIARLYPQLLSPRGRWSLKVDLEGGQWAGRLHLEDAALAPIPGLGLIQGIGGDLALRGRTLEIGDLAADLGGRKVRLGGSIEFPRGEPARYHVTLRGRDVPLIRQAGLVVRADLDLRAETSGGATRLEGTAKVGEGVLLGDLGDLLPRSEAGGQRPPPYFSVEDTPFSKWLLDVDVSAERTLKARTALFTGTASGRVRLGGTMADPTAVGRLWVDRGQLSLPFATFAVQFATVRLSPEDPFHPQLEADATGRTYGYDVRMDARGPADDPLITFSSNPSLPSDQVLLLVMAGQVPTTPGSAAATPSQVAGLGAYLGQGLFSGLGGGASDRLEVTSGQEVSLKGRPTYEIDYRFAPRGWFVLQYDQFDDYDAGIKWRVLSGGGNP